MFKVTLSEREQGPTLYPRSSQSQSPCAFLLGPPHPTSPETPKSLDGSLLGSWGGPSGPSPGPQGRDTKYLLGSHLSLGALLVSKQQEEERKEKEDIVS